MDITDRRALEDELRRARDELEARVEERTAELRRSQEEAVRAGRLAAIAETMAGLAHESRNVIQRGQSCLERLGWRLADRQAELALLREAQQAQADLLRLYEDARGFAAPVVLDPRACDLARVWRDAREAARASHPGRDARPGEPAGPGPVCDADPFRLAGVFRNGFDNALAACPDPAVVTLAWSATALAGRPCACRCGTTARASGRSSAGGCSSRSPRRGPRGRARAWRLQPESWRPTGPHRGRRPGRPGSRDRHHPAEGPTVTRPLRVVAADDEAFRRLRRLASDQNRKAVEVARSVLGSDEVFRALEARSPEPAVRRG